ncbi:MAG TPA: hypothetical protein O0X32_03085 [Methanocorpusculum sp.]|nr:hypothetical protein [Methanocorpusculum sp.]
MGIIPRRRGFKNAGLWSEDAMHIAHWSFKLTLTYTIPRLVRRNRNQHVRVAGKNVVKQLLHVLGRKVDGSNTDFALWCQKNGVLLSKIYDIIASSTGVVFKSCARVCGAVMRSVFHGLHVLDALIDAVIDESDIDNHDYDDILGIDSAGSAGAGSAVSRC